jgi:sec-independent protein translocase protein TatA
MGLGALQPGHLIVILVIVLLIFGPGKLPELGKSIGEGIKELKKATSPEETSASGAATAASTTTPVAGASTSTATITPISAATAKTCPSCHGSVPAGDKFCGNCGASMEAAPTTA